MQSFESIILFICVWQPRRWSPIIPISLYSCPYIIPFPWVGTGLTDSLLANRKWQKWWDSNSEIRLYKRPWLPSWAFPCVCLSVCLITICHVVRTFRQSTEKRMWWEIEVYQQPHEWAWKWRLRPLNSHVGELASDPPHPAFTWDHSLGWQLHFNLSSTSKTLSQRHPTKLHLLLWSKFVFIGSVFWGNLLHNNR